MTRGTSRHGTIVRPSGGARLADGGTISWTAALAPHGEWSTCVEVIAVRGNVEIESTYRCGESLETAAPSQRHATWRAGLPSVTSDVTGLVDACERAGDDLGALRIFDPTTQSSPPERRGS